MPPRTTRKAPKSDNEPVADRLAGALAWLRRRARKSVRDGMARYAIPFLKCLPLIERGAADGRNFVKKAVSWALRGVGRPNAKLHAAAIAVARRLAAATDAAPQWVGKDALRDLTRPKPRSAAK